MRRIHTLLSATLLAAVLAVPAHAQGGVLNRLGRTVRGAAAGSFAMSLEKERQIGREVAGVVTGRWHPVTSAALTDYVNLVGTVVAQQSPRVTEVPFRFAVLDTDEINAFAAPGGYIFVTRGALELMESEAELAGVLGHEIAHVDQKHVLEQVRKGNMITGAASENDLNGPVMDKAVETLAGVIFKGLDRASELESDSLGMLYASAAGYRADGMVRFLERMSQGEQQQRRGFAAIRATHPPASLRLEAAQVDVAAFGFDLTVGPTLEARFRQHVPRASAPPR